MLKWHMATISEVVLELGTDINIGRTNLDSQRSRKSENRVFKTPLVDSRSIIRQIASESSLILLVVAYVIACISSGYTEAFISIPVLLLVCVTSYYLCYFSEKRITDSYRLLLPKAKVIENGKKIRLSTLDVEVGDLIYFSKGDIIPADARVVSSTDLYMAERIYNEYSGKTEYKKCKKNHETVINDDTPSHSFENMVYATSMVVAGKGRAIVTAIGDETCVCKVHNGIALVPNNDSPEYLKSFHKFTKRFSLSVLFLLVPVSLGLIFFTANKSLIGTESNILYTFISILALAVTSMTELISLPASAIIYQSLYPLNKNVLKSDSGITKRSSTEFISEIDTVLILCPEVLKDEQCLVRRVFFSDREYKFDLLNSPEINMFSKVVDICLNGRNNKLDSSYINAINRFLSGRELPEFDYDSKVIQTEDFNSIMKCTYFRTDGGSKWKFSDEVRNNLISSYNDYQCLGMKVFMYISFDHETDSTVFEGMIAIGEEYTFSDGKLISEFKSNGITPVLFLKNENEYSVNFALNCGIANTRNDIVFASEFRLMDNTTGIEQNSSVYIGFDHNEIQNIVKVLSDSGKHILPIIKDSYDRSAISPLTVYATHSEKSFDSVKVSSSLSLAPVDSGCCNGGLKDALNSIKNSRLARMKLGIFNNYLSFSTLFRISSVLLPLFFDASLKSMTGLMILFSWIATDGIALLVIKNTKVVTCPNNVLNNGTSLSRFLYAAGGGVVAILSFIFLELLLSIEVIYESNAQIFTFYLSVIIGLFVLFGFLMIIKRRTGTIHFNLLYTLVSTAVTTYLITQNWFAESVFHKLAELSYSRVGLISLAFTLLLGVLSVVIVLSIDKLLHTKTN